MFKQIADTGSNIRTLPARRFIGLLSQGIGYLAIFWLFVLPLIMLLYGAFRTSPFGAQSAWTLDGFIRAYSDPQTYASLWNSLLYATGSTIVAMAVAIFFAVVVTRFDVALRRLITPAMVILFAFPSVMYFLGWTWVAAGDAGLIGKVLQLIGLSGVAEAMEVRSWIGLIIVTGIKASALAYFVILGAFRNRNTSGEEGARISGAGRVRALIEIELPQLAPALTAAGILVFIKTIEIFEAPAILATPARINVYSTHLFGYLRGATTDYGAASAGSFVLVITLAVLVALQGRLMRGGVSFVTVGARATKATLHQLTRGRIFVTISIALLVVTVLLPVTQVAVTALTPYLGSWDITLDNFLSVLGNQRTMEAVRTSILVSAFGGLLTVTLAFVVAYAFVRSKSRGAKFIRLASWIPLSMTGIVLGIAFLWTVLSTPGARSLYGTMWLLVIGLGVATVPIATRVIEGALVQVPIELDHAARISGAGFVPSVVGVTVRLILPSLFSAWLVVAILMSGILDIPILLGAPGAQMVSQVSYLLYQNGYAGNSAATYLVFLACFAAVAATAAGVFYLLRFVLKRFHSKLGGFAQ